MLILIIFCCVIQIVECTSFSHPCGLTPIKPHFFKNSTKQYDARPFSWPWAAKFCNVDIDDQSLDCNVVGVGSVIGSRWILSTSYEEPILSYLRIKIGIYNYQAEEGPGLAIHEVKSVTNHPDAQAEENSLALLELKDEIQFNKYVQPICLPLHDDVFTQKNYSSAWVTGWSIDGHSLKHRHILEQTHIRVLFPPRHPGMFGSISRHQNEVLAGGQMIRKSKVNKKWFQYGVSGSDYNPVVAVADFARVAHSCDWISEATRGEVNCIPPNADF